MIKGLDRWLTEPPDDDSGYIEAVSEAVTEDVWAGSEDYFDSEVFYKHCDKLRWKGYGFAEAAIIISRLLKIKSK